jgi:uncharacterized protein
MNQPSHLTVGATENNTSHVLFDLRMANRHGLIAGATGSGKTVTLQVLAELFSLSGVPVVAPDIKGDLSGIALPSTGDERVLVRAAAVGIDTFTPTASPTILWKLVRGKGHPLRTTVSEFGPILLSSILGLNETQEAVLMMLFRCADQQGLLLLDFKDLDAVIKWAMESSKELEKEFGKMQPATLSTIQRKILAFEEQGGADILGEPALQLMDLMRTTVEGRGYISIIHAEESLHNPKSYTSFLLWLLSELFETLPEVGDIEKPRLVFFFDEAHLLFDDANKVLIDKLETIIRLIRSKGVGVYFVTQRPHDIPDAIASQLANRFQHALRAFTPQERKALKSAADSLPSNKGEDLEKVIPTLATGEALVSLLDPHGTPQITQRIKIRPPFSQIGPLTDDQREKIMQLSPVAQKYDQLLDRESAFEELLARRKIEESSELHPDEEVEPETKRRKQTESTVGTEMGSFAQKTVENAAKFVIRGLSYRLGAQLIRGIMGSLRKRR